MWVWVYPNPCTYSPPHLTPNDTEHAQVGASIKFAGAKTIYGIPERAVDLALKSGHTYSFAIITPHPRPTNTKVTKV